MPKMLKTVQSIGHSLIKGFWQFLKGSNAYNADLDDSSLQSPTKLILKKLFSNKRALLGSLGFIAVFLLSFVGSMIVPIHNAYIELTHTNLRPGINYLNYPKTLTKTDIVKIASGVSFSAAITTSGELYLWGTEPNKSQGNVSGYIFDIPKEVTESVIVDIACGGNHIIAVDDNRNFYGWGYDGNGQLNIPSTVERTFSNRNISIAQMDAKSQWTAILGSDGKLHIWGSSQARTNFLIPSRLQGHIKQFAGGDTNMALLLDDGTIAIIGDRGSEFAMQVPSELQDGSLRIIDIAATNKNVLALSEKGKLYTWGSTQDNLTNLPIIEEPIDSIYAGYKNFLVLSTNGNVTMWGNTIYNQVFESKKQGNIETIFANYYQFYAIGNNNSIHSFGNNGFIFGTDQFGRDIFTRIIHGGRISLTVGAIAVVISVILALFVGLAAGYFGGIIDHALMRLADVFSSIPFYPIAITLSYAIGHDMNDTQKLYLIMIILGLLGWMSLARLIRAQLLLEREKDFVLAARALGIKNNTIMWRHILPNIFSLVIVNISLGYTGSLLSEAALSFLGFGISEPTPSWGNMLTSSQDIAVIQFYWWRWLIPALFVIFTAVCVNLIGDALREAMDPKTSER